MKTITSAQMRELDRLTVESGTSPETLMERAGTQAGRLILDFISTLHPAHARRIVLLAGKGNNGGDAYVAARYLSANSDLDVCILSICGKDDLSGEARLNFDRLPDTVSCEFRSELRGSDFTDGDIIVDGLLGIGIKGVLRQPYRNWIEAINVSGRPVVSLDIPSGLSGDDGSTGGAAVKADLTITIGLPKIGLFTGRGPELCGRLRCVDIGIPHRLIERIPSETNAVFMADVTRFLGRLDMDSHKGSRGHVLIIGGSAKYGGAPFLSGEGALRSGAGMVTVAVPHGIIAQSHARSLIERRISDNGTGFFSAGSYPELAELISVSDAVVVGPGMGEEPHFGKLLGLISEIDKPVVFDADALNIISKNPEIISKRIYPSVLTPHPGEMKRLLSGLDLRKFLQSDRFSQAAALAEKNHSTAVLKGHRTVISARGRRTFVNTSGTPALSSAGTGDVLSGMVGSFIAQGLSTFDASICAVFIHGLAGEGRQYGSRGLTADDLPALIPLAMKEISPFA